MRIGFDVDGVLANFCEDYEALFVRHTGRDTFERYDAEVGPKSWNWPAEHYGYTAEETSKVWNDIKTNPFFCVGLRPLPDTSVLKKWLDLMRSEHCDCYFITSRVGVYAKWGTELWLQRHLGIEPTVLVVAGKEKGVVGAALKLDLFVEDNLDNAITMAAAGVTTYLINRAYNQGDLPFNVLRVTSLGEVLAAVPVTRG